MMKKNDGYYRFALIGLSGSGKTCILTQMVQNADSNKRFTSLCISKDKRRLSEDERLRVLDYIDSDNRGTKKKNRKLDELCELYYYNLGNDVIDAALRQLKDEKTLPKATELTFMRALVDFQLSEKTRGDFGVQTLDYAGEYVKPDDLQNEDSYSTRLKNHLADCDGLLIVVETPDVETDDQKIRESNTQLATFFAAIQKILNESGRNKVTPIALLLSKWDRYAEPIQFDNLDAEREKVRKFFNTHQSYDKIRGALSGIVNGQTKLQNNELTIDSSDDNLAVFPVSAFGRTIERDGKKTLDLESPAFGLIEPFYFLANRRDELDFAALEEELDGNKTSKLNICKYWRVMKQCKNMKPRFSNQTNETNATRLADVGTRAFKRFCNLLLLYAMFAALLAFFGAGCFNYSSILHWNRQVTEWEQIVENPETTDAELDSVQEEIDAENGRFHGIPAKSIDELESKLRTKRDDRAWENVMRGSTDEEKARRASAYLEKFPEGSHRDEAKETILIGGTEGRHWAKVLSYENNPDEQLKSISEHLGTYPNGAFKKEAKELQENILWAKVESSKDNPDKQFENVNKYGTVCPKGLHIQEAEKLLSTLPEKIQWTNVWSLNGNPDEQLVAIREFLGKYPKGIYAPNAKELLDNLLWAKVESSNDNPDEQFENVKKYISECPEGRHIQEAKDLVATLPEKIQWTNVLSLNDNLDEQLTGVNEYLGKYPNGVYATVAKELRDNLLWSKVLSSNGNPDEQENRINAYMRVCPDGSHIEEAKKLLDEISWTEVLSLNGNPDEQSKSVSEYIRVYPEGRHIEEAKKLQTELQDNMAWAKVLSQKSNPDEQLKRVCEYIQTCPNGLHIVDAKKLQAELQDDMAWTKTLAQKSAPDEQLKSVIEYIQTYPDGRHADDANKLQATLLWTKAKASYTDIYKKDDLDIVDLTNKLTSIIDDFDPEEEQIQLLEGYPKRIEDVLRSYTSDPTASIRKIQKAIELYRGLETKLLERWGQTNAQIISDKYPNLNKMLEERIDAYDVSLYDDFRNNPSESNGRVYLEKMKDYNNGGAMKEVVEKYLVYLEKVAAVQNVTFKIKIRWGKNAKKGKNPFVNLRFNGTELINGVPLNQKDKKVEIDLKKDLDLGSFVLKDVNPREVISVFADIYYEYRTYGSIGLNKINKPIGKCELVEIPLYDFQRPEGRVISLDDGTQLIVTAEKTDAPSLPMWLK